jgi:beta-lactamase regulating signal transducer with metallopeptidase domain
MKLGHKENDMTAASSIAATVLPGTVLADLGEVLANVTRVTLVSAVLGGTVLVCVGLIEATLFRRAAAAVRHRVWGMTLAALLVVPFLSLVAPQCRVPIVPPTVIEVAGSAVWPEGEASEPTPRPAGNSPSASNAGAANSLPQIATEDRAPSRNGVSRSVASWARRLSYESVALMIWLSGVALLLIRILVGGLRTSVLLRHAKLLTDRDCRALVEELRLQLGLRREVRLLEYPDAIVPMTLGVLRPVILLPESARAWSEQARRAVLLHELAHIKRGDVAFQLLGRVACALHWFQPLAWWGLYRLRVEREHACDDVVLQAGERASDYAEQLLAVARRCRRPNGLALAVEMTRGASLEQRVRVLFDAARSHLPLSRRWAVALLVLMMVLAGGAAVFRPVKWQEQHAGLEKGPLKERVRVIDAKGRPVRGAKLIDMGFGTTAGAEYNWPNAWPKDFETDAAGVVVISVPDVSGVSQHGGIRHLDFSVTHPNHPIKRVIHPLPENDRPLTYGPVTLEDPLKVRIRASRTGGGGPVTTDLFLQASGRTGQKWTLVDGILRADTLSPTDPDGGRYLRVIHAPAGQPMWFSHLIDLKQQVAEGGTGELNLTLHPGVRVEGKLADDVPRPVTKGIVSASIVEGVDSPLWNWQDSTRLQADGTFIFASVPRETDLQLIAVCDGWTSRSPTAAEIDEYSQKNGLKGPTPFSEGDGMVAARLYRLTGTVAKPVLPMQRSTSCEVTVIDPLGKPIEGVQVRFVPIEIWSNGSSILGHEWSSLERLRNKGATKIDWSKLWDQMFKPYTTRTDSKGKGIIRGLIPGRTRFSVELKGHEVVPDLSSVAWESVYREAQVELKAGETGSATVTMRRKE